MAWLDSLFSANCSLLIVFRYHFLDVCLAAMLLAPRKIIYNDMKVMILPFIFYGKMFCFVQVAQSIKFICGSWMKTGLSTVQFCNG